MLDNNYIAGNLQGWRDVLVAFFLALCLPVGWVFPRQVCCCLAPSHWLWSAARLVQLWRQTWKLHFLREPWPVIKYKTLKIFKCLKVNTLIYIVPTSTMIFTAVPIPGFAGWLCALGLFLKLSPFCTTVAGHRRAFDRTLQHQSVMVLFFRRRWKNILHILIYCIKQTVLFLFFER